MIWEAEEIKISQNSFENQFAEENRRYVKPFNFYFPFSLLVLQFLSLLARSIASTSFDSKRKRPGAPPPLSSSPRGHLKAPGSLSPSFAITLLLSFFPFEALFRPLSLSQPRETSGLLRIRKGQRGKAYDRERGGRTLLRFDLLGQAGPCSLSERGGLWPNFHLLSVVPVLFFSL